MSILPVLTRVALPALASAGAACASIAHESLKEAMSGLSAPPYRRPPLFSAGLVVPAYNEAKYLPLLLSSAHNQTEGFATLVVADSSDDGGDTARVAASYGAHVVHVPYGNVAAARNAGAHEAGDVDVLVFADADVVLPSRFVEIALSVLERGYVATHPREAIYDSPLWNVLQFPWANALRPRTMTTRCVATWREHFDALGGYDESCNPLHGCREDLALGRRIAARWGPTALAVMPATIATSARRMKTQGTGFSPEKWGVPVRSKRVRRQ